MNSQTSGTEPAFRQVATFRVAGHYFGLPVEEVQEVLRPQQMTPVPLAPPVVEGLINLRGQIVTALDLRTRLGLPTRPAGETAMNLVVKSDHSAPVSLLVDSVGDVLPLEHTNLEETPENVNAVTRALLAGVYKLDGELLLLLDRAKALAVTAPAQNDRRLL